jgi:hypothetical protein
VIEVVPHFSLPTVAAFVSQSIRGLPERLHLPQFRVTYMIEMMTRPIGPISRALVGGPSYLKQLFYYGGASESEARPQGRWS